MRRAVLALLSAAAFAGCTFSRSVVNPQVRALDTSWIRPGATTRAEVVERLGMPPSSKDSRGVTPSSLRWTASDTFTATLEAGYIVTPTFERARQHHAEDILVLFDRQGVVELVSRTRSKDGLSVDLVEWKER